MNRRPFSGKGCFQSRRLASLALSPLPNFPSQPSPLKLPLWSVVCYNVERNSSILSTVSPSALWGGGIKERAPIFCCRVRGM